MAHGSFSSGASLSAVAEEQCHHLPWLQTTSRQHHKSLIRDHLIVSRTSSEFQHQCRRTYVVTDVFSATKGGDSLVFIGKPKPTERSIERWWNSRWWWWSPEKMERDTLWESSRRRNQDVEAVSQNPSQGPSHPEKLTLVWKEIKRTLSYSHRKPVDNRAMNTPRLRMMFGKQKKRSWGS